MTFRKAVIWMGAAALATGVATAAIDAAAIIKTRKDNYKTMGKAVKDMATQLKSGNADKAVLAADAKVIEKLAPQIPTWFPAGTGPDSGVKTEAKAVIWSNPSEFAKDADALAKASHELAQATTIGDTATIVAKLKATGEACKTCHQTFKSKDD